MHLAQKAEPEALIAIDLAPLPPNTPLVLDNRPAIWSKDSHSHYDHGLLLELIAAGREVNIEMQTVAYEQAASDASIAFNVGATDRALCFGWACGNSHGYETVRVGALENTLRSLHRFVLTR